LVLVGGTVGAVITHRGCCRARSTPSIHNEPSHAHEVVSLASQAGKSPASVNNPWPTACDCASTCLLCVGCCTTAAQVRLTYTTLSLCKTRAPSALQLLQGDIHTAAATHLAGLCNGAQACHSCCSPLLSQQR
jgi:hypothetical protein